MESYQRESMRRIRRNSSRTLLQDLLYKGGGGGGGDRDTPIPVQPGRDAKMIHSIASLIRGRSKLLLLENPDTVEIYKLNESTARSERAAKDDVYLPDIRKNSSNLTSMRGALSHSCPYLYDKRRGSFSSVASQRTGGLPKKQSLLKAQREAKKSNVTVTMTYLGQGRRGSGLKVTQEELKVLQQVNGGENVCVFKGLVTPGEQFQFLSQRHRGFPFSATLYVDGLMVARISSCCEYRYAPGFQQGRKSCFRLSWLAGGIPCYRCTSLRNKYSSCQQLNTGPEQNFILPLEKSPGNGPVESCPSSPLFVPAKPERKSVRRVRKHIRDGGGASTDSEDQAAARFTESVEKKRKKSHTRHKDKGQGGRRAGNEGREEGQKPRGVEVSQRSRVTAEREEQKTSRHLTALQTEQPRTNKTSNTVEEAPTRPTPVKQTEQGSNGKSRDGERLRDFYEECVEMSGALERGPNKHNWFKANSEYRNRSTSWRGAGSRRGSRPVPRALASDVELSPESDTILQPEGEEEEEEDRGSQSPEEEEPDKEQDLQEQGFGFIVSITMKKLPTEREKFLKVRQSGPVDVAISQTLDAMMTVLSTSDEVEQLVLRNTGLTDDLLLRLAGALKSSLSEVALLNLNLNLIGPYGAHILLDVLRVKPQVKGLHLFGNKLRDHGVMTLLNGIAELQEQTARTAAAIQQAMLLPSEQNMLLQLPTGWRSFRIILDENNLGDPGVRLLADTLKENTGLRQVDLDRNGISDVGGNDLMGALLCRARLPLRHLSLQENHISAGLMSRIQEEPLQIPLRGTSITTLSPKPPGG
ncbi:unnamed protein product [Pleuronectes platessa]|uniref:DUF4590 domain-containing protein n=1 Tax=Pleuronectes platessa TaxID=8262 RepID=A0A9N7YNQ6_PLEPL|nr:unnamed protein product [Pleuronectes platessa]